MIKKKDKLTVTVKADRLMGLLSDAAAVAESGGSFSPWTAYALLDASADGTLSVSSTDLAITVERRCPCDTASPGSALVRPRQLLNALKNFRGAEVRLDAEDDHSLSLSYLNIVDSTFFKARFTGADPADFMVPSRARGGAEFTVNSHDVAIRLNQVLFALNPKYRAAPGVCLDCASEEGTLTFKAADSYCAAVAGLPADGIGPGFFGDPGMFLLSRKACDALRLFCAGERAPVTFRMNHEENALEAETENAALFMRRLGGKFPDLGPLFNLDRYMHPRLELDRHKFLDALKSLAAVTGPKNAVVYLKIAKGADGCELSAESELYGRACAVLPFDGGPPEIHLGFNPDTAFEAVRPMMSGKMRLSLVDDRTPVLIDGENDPDRLALLSCVTPPRGD